MTETLERQVRKVEKTTESYDVYLFKQLVRNNSVPKAISLIYSFLREKIINQLF